MDILICLDDNGNMDGPVTDGPKDAPIWSLYARDGRSYGVCWGEWGMSMYGSGLTYQQALDLADARGLHGHLMS